MSAHGRCDRILVTVLVSRLNSYGVWTFGKIFIGIVLKESLSCKCWDNEGLVFCYIGGVSFGSFGDMISSVGFESLFPKRLPVWVLFRRLGVGFGVRSIDMCLFGGEDGRHGFNWPKVQLLNASMMVFGFGLSSCGWLVAPIRCSIFGLSSISAGVPYDYMPRLGGKFLLLASPNEFSSDSSSSTNSNNWKPESTKNYF
jgi:hypothetical protein